MIPTSATTKNPPVSVARLLALALLTRLFTDTSFQIFFPFLPILAAGLGTTPIVLGRLLSVQSAVGLLLPFLELLALPLLGCPSLFICRWLC